jgi:hypothetical protein
MKTIEETLAFCIEQRDVWKGRWLKEKTDGEDTTASDFIWSTYKRVVDFIEGE